MSPLQRDAIRWLAKGEVGLSSRCMALWLAFGERSDDFYPRDPADFDRCLRLLQSAPGLRTRLPRMAELSPEWAALVRRWDDIEASHLSEVGLGWSKGDTAPVTYALMKEVIEGALR